MCQFELFLYSNCLHEVIQHEAACARSPEDNCMIGLWGGMGRIEMGGLCEACVSAEESRTASIKAKSDEEKKRKEMLKDVSTEILRLNSELQAAQVPDPSVAVRSMGDVNDLYDLKARRYQLPEQFTETGKSLASQLTLVINSAFQQAESECQNLNYVYWKVHGRKAALQMSVNIAEGKPDDFSISQEELKGIGANYLEIFKWTLQVAREKIIQECHLLEIDIAKSLVDASTPSPPGVVAAAPPMPPGVNNNAYIVPYNIQF